ncbi:hypothetical protein MTO96_009146 [Rhipicephalus appendiculatus]
MAVSFQLTLALLLVLCALDLKAEILKGYPCIRRLNQLYCPTPGNGYPKERIDMFIDENKALIRRMFGEYSSPDEDGGHRDHYETYDGKTIHTRTERSRSSFAGASSNKVDACESAVEIVTPYWASNSAGKIRAIVNTQHLQQAIQQEVCQSVQTKKCNNDCSCEQKYKWHRLLAYDPDDDSCSIDWLVFLAVTGETDAKYKRSVCFSAGLSVILVASIIAAAHFLPIYEESGELPAAHEATSENIVVFGFGGHKGDLAMVNTLPPPVKSKEVVPLERSGRSDRADSGDALPIDDEGEWIRSHTLAKSNNTPAVPLPAPGEENPLFELEKRVEPIARVTPTGDSHHAVRKGHTAPRAHTHDA